MACEPVSFASYNGRTLEFETATLHIRRAKGGTTTTHPLLGDELRALRALKREAKSAFTFVSERGAPFTVAGLAKLIERAGIGAKIGFKVHPHMLRHAAGFVLALRTFGAKTILSPPTGHTLASSRPSSRGRAGEASTLPQ